MDPEFRGDADHHDGTSDAAPGGYVNQRRPGELGFAIFLTLASLYLLYDAYNISGFQALSAPGAIPMATTFVMAISAVIIVLRTAPLPRVRSETFRKDILPVLVIAFIGLLIGFGILLKPLGFLPTALLFLTLSIKLLTRKTWPYSLGVSVGSLVIIWIVFRVVFTVLLPAGIVPEAEFLQLLRNLANGGA
ncbi:tripartite tricarboxylate transporter TctB family protein [Loktanella sp. IMCC34160]|uniref:tripartite tricarboxylate transporter TctB family protein n=1 Tax=Loktanella sp. IMCC34160 TaxID=2510646 RepID=UPI00101C2BCC|nr:tripartite tricarboxylate transporter TctB family protein [Loktanella sp. IMCC34160]RYG89216.1 tripartite tricarboxylate transporter TctB family protein [Loktanella sp. IMCC34160]